MKSLGESMKMEVKTIKTGARFESFSAPRTRHNTNPPEIIIKGRIINLANRKTKNLKNIKEGYNESRRKK